MFYKLASYYVKATAEHFTVQVQSIASSTTITFIKYVRATLRMRLPVHPPMTHVAATNLLEFFVEFFCTPSSSWRGRIRKTWALICRETIKEASTLRRT
jgi:hypothetical protein